MPETEWPVTDEQVRDARTERIATALETIAALLLVQAKLMLVDVDPADRSTRLLGMLEWAVAELDGGEYLAEKL